jgi:hypothetical protein
MRAAGEGFIEYFSQGFVRDFGVPAVTVGPWRVRSKER